MTSPKFQTAKTVKHTQLTPKIHYFVFEQEKPVIFKPGQYISIKVAENRINSYSIARKQGNNQFCLLIDTSPKGPGSMYFEKLKVEDTISYLGPFGIFTFKPNDGAKHILFLATGCGCTPLRCMIEEALFDKKITIPITLYFGLRYEEDIFWVDYFQQLEKEYPNFTFKLVLSKGGEKWKGLSGHITDFIKKDHSTGKNYSAYVCGNPKMIEDAKTILQEIDCQKDRIYFEAFV